MALVGQGLAFCFIGGTVLLLAFLAPHSACVKVIFSFCAAMLLAFSVWTGSTGAQSEYFLLRLSHFVSIVAAALLLLAQVQG